MRRSNATKHNEKLIELTKFTKEIFSSYKDIANTNGARVKLCIKKIIFNLTSIFTNLLTIQRNFLDNFLTIKRTKGIKIINRIIKNPLTKNEDERLYLYTNLFGGF